MTDVRRPFLSAAHRIHVASSTGTVLSIKRSAGLHAGHTLTAEG